jgi:hypothetical protein
MTDREQKVLEDKMDRLIATVTNEARTFASTGLKLKSLVEAKRYIDAMDIINDIAKTVPYTSEDYNLAREARRANYPK